jgi:hypothetical protein
MAQGQKFAPAMDFLGGNARFQVVTLAIFKTATPVSQNPSAFQGKNKVVLLLMARASSRATPPPARHHGAAAKWSLVIWDINRSTESAKS